MVNPSVRFLSRRLNHRYRVIRWSATWLLGRMGHPDAVESLVPLLGDPDRHVRQAAIQALARIGERGINPLIEAWRPETQALWPEMSTVLVKIGRPAVEPLIRALSDRREMVRMLAIGALGWIGDRRAIGPLLYIMCHEQDHIRLLIAMSLVKIGEPAVQPLIETLYGENEEIWPISAKALKLIGTPAVKPLIEALDVETDQTRILAATVLGWIGDVRAIDPLSSTLTDANSEVREAAVEALARLGCYVPVA